MAKKPSLNDQSFLAHLFGPKRNPQPSGLRKTHLSGTRGGRSKGRLAAFNRMSPVNQELLKRSGLREDYLRGNVSLGIARQSVRPQAVSLGVAKPPRPSTSPLSYVIKTPLDARVAAHLKGTVRAEGRPVNDQHVDENISLAPEDVLSPALGWSYGEFKHAGRAGSEYESLVDGKTRNPFWYH